MKLVTFEVVHPVTQACAMRRGPQATVLCEREIGHEEFHAGRSRRGGWILWQPDRPYGRR